LVAKRERKIVAVFNEARFLHAGWGRCRATRSCQQSGIQEMLGSKSGRDNDYPEASGGIMRQMPPLGHKRFLSNPFQFIK
jgi:hypothetical protein